MLFAAEKILLQMISMPLFAADCFSPLMILLIFFIVTMPAFRRDAMPRRLFRRYFIFSCCLFAWLLMPRLPLRYTITIFHYSTPLLMLSPG